MLCESKAKHGVRLYSNLFYPTIHGDGKRTKRHVREVLECIQRFSQEKPPGGLSKMAPVSSPGGKADVTWLRVLRLDIAGLGGMGTRAGVGGGGYMGAPGAASYVCVPGSS